MNSSRPKYQSALVQSSTEDGINSLPIKVSSSKAIPALRSEYDVLVKVLAVALNPSDIKNLTYFPSPGQGVGCDYCGLVTEKGSLAKFDVETRVCGAAFPYNQHDGKDDASTCGAFSEWVVADSRILIRVPDKWDDLEGAALGGVGWCTAVLALSDVDALALEALPSKPLEKGEPVLVYGGATATGTMACQLLRRSGYRPFAVTSVQSAPLAIKYGAVGTVPYTSASCAEDIKTLVKEPIRHVLDCITSVDSSITCFAAMARTGGRYACVEALNDSWRTRKLIKVKEVMGFEALGRTVHLTNGASCYSRDANPELFLVCQIWRDELQDMVDSGNLEHHPIREIAGKWEGIATGLNMLKSGEVRAEKLVVRIDTPTYLSK